MTTKVSTNVRLVRCPKCRQVLPELPGVSLYKCGGCGTILQAKIRKVETNHSELSSQETDPVAKNQLNDLEEKEEATSSSHDSNSPPKVESCSPEDTSLRDEASPVEDEELSKCNNPLVQNSKRFHVESKDDEGEWTGGRNFSSEFFSSGEFAREAEAYNSDVGEHAKQEDSVDQMECGESKEVWQEDDSKRENQESFLHAVSEQKEGIQNNNVPPENDEKSRVYLSDQNGGFDGGNKGAASGSSSGTISCENNNITNSMEHSMEVDDGADGQLPSFRSSSTERNMNGSLVSFYLSSPDEEHLDHSLRERSRKFERISSVDTLGSSLHDDLNSELNSKHPSMTNYRTGSYDAYDGSESSYGGNDDKIRQHISRPWRKSKPVDYISTKDMLRKERFRVNKAMSSEPERSSWATSASHRATTSSSQIQDIYAEMNTYSSGNRMRLDKQEAGSRLPFTSRDPLTGHRTSGISSYQHDLLPRRHGFNSSEKPSCLEPDNMHLLRTVWELEDQLNRMRFSKVMTNRRFTPFQYDHIATESKIYADHPGGYNPRFNQAKGNGERCNVSRQAFSGEPGNYRHQVSCSCLHCCPQDWHCSAQLPSCSVHRENGHHLVHSDHNFWNISSPQHYTSAEHLLWGCETKSDNQRPDEMTHLPLKEKYHHTVKRHLRPIAGGAPVISCNYCWEVLQLPIDFLLFKKRYHQLRCNACKKVLKFSLFKGTHLVPCLPDASAPPPSEVDDYNNATSQRNLDPLSHCSSCQNAEPVSCSDDYGLSFRRSCSTEGEASFGHAEKNTYNRKMLSGSSYQPMEDRKMKSILREPRNKSVSLLENVESVGPSTKMPEQRKATSEIEELPTSSNSPLHRLMGYSSPSQVLNK